MSFRNTFLPSHTGVCTNPKIAAHKRSAAFAAGRPQMRTNTPFRYSQRASHKTATKPTVAANQPPVGSGLTTSRSDTVRNSPIPPNKYSAMGLAPTQIKGGVQVLQPLTSITQ